jgi:hypothetical protein
MVVKKNALDASPTRVSAARKNSPPARRSGIFLKAKTALFVPRWKILGLSFLKDTILPQDKCPYFVTV